MKRQITFRNRIAVCILLAVLPNTSVSQTLGNWLMVFNNTRLSERWGIHTEAQYRSYELLPNSEQLLLRGGINFHFGGSVSATVGYANISNYAFNKDSLPGVQVNESRTWQQILMRHSIGGVFLEHRYRLEQRWLNSSTSSRYLNRLRYLLRANVPLNSEQIKESTWFLSFYNELFLNTANGAFDRNRLYGAVGYQLTPELNLQCGTMAQTVNLSTILYLQLSASYNVDFREVK